MGSQGHKRIWERGWEGKRRGERMRGMCERDRMFECACKRENERRRRRRRRRSQSKRDRKKKDM